MGSTRPPVGAASFLLAATALLVGCGAGDGGADRTSTAGPAPGTQARTVTIADYAFGPAELTVPAGTTVTFVNRDRAPHTATSQQSGAFDSGTIKGGRSGQVRLEQPGTFAYFCAFHPFMKGTIVVE